MAGSGDVLVFRKVRSGAPVLPKVETPAEAHEKAVNQERKRVTNPIDGMQSTPITGDFASPTGFVNYDLPRGSETPFKSNIDVRREEPVFSGRRIWEDEVEEERPKAKGKGKRLLVGAAWVAACSYAVGVVSEFFRTGGMDMMDFLYKRCPPDWSPYAKWQWHGQSLSQLQSSAERFVPILDYEHFSTNTFIHKIGYE